MWSLKLLIFASTLLCVVPVFKVAGKDAYLSPCQEYQTDSQRWLFKYDRLGHETLVKVFAEPDWCLAVDLSGTTSVDVELCEPQPPLPHEYNARVWDLAEDGTIRTLVKTGSCLAVSTEGKQPQLVMADCNASLTSGTAQWDIFKNGTIQVSSNTSANWCLTVNLTSPTPIHPTNDLNVVAYTCRDDNQNQQWSGPPGEDGTIQLLNSTSAGTNGSWCLTAHGEYPGSHGTNVVIMRCNASQEQKFSYNESTGIIRSKSTHSCPPSSDNGAACDCVNIAHTTPTPQPENNIELWQCNAQDSNGTETWTYNATSHQFQSCGLCLTVSTLT